MLAISSRLGPYEILAPLGAGGMGEVYRARDTRLGREVAVKVLPEPVADNADRQARFEREARAVAALSHPNILAIHDYGTEGGITYAVMELLEGETLRSRLTKGPLPWREAVEIGAAIADGLAAAHAKGIIHRDLKPENLFLTADGRVKILDFGLARFEPTANPQEETGPYVPSQTGTGVVMGTAGYMSPEQVRGQSVDARSDLFSFGCVLYEMVSGRRAFRRETAAETMTAILNDEPPDALTAGHLVPAELGRLIRQCLVKTPNQRLQSAHDLALGLRSLASNPTLHSAPRARRLSLRQLGIIAAASLIGVIGLIGASVYFLNSRRNTSAERKTVEGANAIESVAVLPFENIGGDPKTEFLSDGVADQIIHNLSQVRRPDLKVRPFTSVARYKGKELDVKAFGRELNVQRIVTGTLRQEGEKLTISVALIDVQEDNQLWGYTYRHNLGAILSLQDQIARDIAVNLRLQLTNEEEKRLTKRYTSDTEAYLLYRKGRHAWIIRTEARLKQSINYFNQAIEKDPDYALAYAGLADSYSSLGYWGGLSPKVAFPKAREAAERALALDKSLAEAHTSLGYIKLHYDWDWPSAEAAFQRAIEADPKLASAYHWYSHALIVMGRAEESLAASKRALEFDPLERNITMHLAHHYYYFRDYDLAIAHLRSVLELEPAFLYAHGLLAMSLLARTGRDPSDAQKSKYAEAVVEAQAAATGQDRPAMVAILGYSYGMSGNKREAQEVLDQLTELSKRRYVSPYDLAIVHVGLGDKDRAIKELRRAYEERSPHLVLLRAEPVFDSLRSDPRFAQILRDMKLLR